MNQIKTENMIKAFSENSKMEMLLDEIENEFVEEEYSLHLLDEKFASFQKSNMSEEEYMDLLIKAAVELTTQEAPKWEMIAARLLFLSFSLKLEETMRKCRITSFYEKVAMLTKEGLYGAYICLLYTSTEYIQNVHTYDREKLEEFVKVKEEVANLKSGLEAEKKEMEAMADVYSAEEKNLQSTLSTMRSQMADFDVQLAEAQKQAEEEARKIEEESQRIEKEQLEEAKNNSNSNKTENNSGSSNETEKEESTNKPSGSENNKPSKPNKPSDNNGNNNNNNNNNSNNSKPDKPSDETDKPSNTSKGQQIANTGLKYVGNPYVYGGNSLTNGIDCSGFTKQIHALCGISGLPRNSSAQRSGGKAVSGGLSNALPGDVICYSGHVAIYIGGGQIVHASNPSPYPKGGIKVSSASYKSILAIRRYW